MANNYIGKNKLKLSNENLKKVLLKEKELRYITR